MQCKGLVKNMWQSRGKDKIKKIQKYVFFVRWPNRQILKTKEN